VDSCLRSWMCFDMTGATMCAGNHRNIHRIVVFATTALLWGCGASKQTSGASKQTSGASKQTAEAPVSPPIVAVPSPEARLDSFGAQRHPRRDVALRIEDPFLTVCRQRGAIKRVYMIGASSTGGLTGPVLRRTFKDAPFEFKFWGKASTGLARPDFHDWPKETKRILKTFKPDLVVVHLGTNDNQGIRMGKGWIRSGKPEWVVEYAKRVAHMLDLIAGPDRSRPIVWVTPVVIRGKNARRLGGLIAKAMRKEVADFDGGVAFLDVFHTTSKGGKGQLMRMPSPNGRGTIAVYHKDGAHLTRKANMALVTRPVQEFIERCYQEASASAGP